MSPNLSGNTAVWRQLQLYFLANIGQEMVHPAYPASYTALKVHF